MNEKEMRAGHVRIWDEQVENLSRTLRGYEALHQAKVTMPNDKGVDTIPGKIANAIDTIEELKKHRALAQVRLDSTD